MTELKLPSLKKKVGHRKIDSTQHRPFFDSELAREHAHAAQEKKLRVHLETKSPKPPTVPLLHCLPKTL